jgi:hypothetical protein
MSSDESASRRIAEWIEGNERRQRRSASTARTDWEKPRDALKGVTDWMREELSI